MTGKSKKAIAAAGVLAAGLSMAAFTVGWTYRQTAAHEIAEQARALGLSEDNPIIVEASRIWWEEERQSSGDTDYASDTGRQVVIPESILIPELEISDEGENNAASYTDYELSILAKLIYKEANGCPWEHMCAVGCVVLNRVADSRFPSTIYDVVIQPGQYHASYVSGFDGIPEECWNAARAVLDGEYTIPANVVWQAQFVQGKGIWWTSCVDTGWWKSTTYFCF